jgi:hypothetical protein
MLLLCGSVVINLALASMRVERAKKQTGNRWLEQRRKLGLD